MLPYTFYPIYIYSTDQKKGQADILALGGMGGVEW